MSKVKRYGYDNILGMIESDYGVSPDWVKSSDYYALQQKLDAVLAENVALKDGIAKANAAVEHWNSWADKEDKISLHIKTPATDTILNEVRAEAELEGMVRGAGRVALEASRVYRDAPTRSEERSLHKRIGHFAHMVARRIRAEGGTND